ncbi:MAG: hypothetical protein JWO40_324 [Candidatus Doudnabacteria bacterium]|nr:hypothetical protein [Candidatus Doudnabacteria bacterium]
MTNKNIGLSVVTVLVIAAIGFFGGMKYGSAHALSAKSLASLSTAQKQLLTQNLRGGGMAGNAGAGGAMGFAGRRTGTGGAAGSGFTAGNIISKDDKSITVSTTGGGSKIIFVSGTTKVGKSVTGAVSDLAVGDQVTITGAANSDGSINAASVDIRPANTVPSTGK